MTITVDSPPLQTHAVSKTYGRRFGRRTEALRDVDLAIPAGSIAALVVAARLRGVGLTGANGNGLTCDPSSWQGLPTDGSLPTVCQDRFNKFFQIDNSQAAPLMGAFMFLGPIAGLLAGVGLVAREIEERTAAVVWSLATSRTRWLVGRVASVAGVLALLLTFTAIAGTELQRARQPSVDPLLSFDNDAGRGLTLVAIGLVVFALAVLIGSVLGRVLPALMVSAVVALFLAVGGMGVRMAWLPSQSVVVDQQNWSSNDGSLYLQQLVRLSSGEIESADGVMWGVDTNGNVIGPLAGSTMMMRVVPGSSHPFVEAVQAAATVAVAGVLLAATALVVRRRRPS